MFCFRDKTQFVKFFVRANTYSIVTWKISCNTLRLTHDMHFRITDLSTYNVKLYVDESSYMEIIKLYAKNSLYVRMSCHIPLNLSIFATYALLNKSKTSGIYIKTLYWVCKSFIYRIITLQANQFPFYLR